MLDLLRTHWREYAIESALLGAFMLSASSFTTLLEHPASPVQRALAPSVRHLLLALAMGLSAITIFYSPWGRRSGAHINPATTLTMLRLGRVTPGDALWYVAAQFSGAVLGMVIASAALGSLIAAPSVRYVVTQPGMRGAGVAFTAELLISAVLMTCVLHSNASPRFQRLTGLLAGALVATFIAIEAPLSGMSMNPARTFASAVAALDWTALWVYLVAPPLGMLAAAQGFLLLRGSATGVCAKMYPHRPGEPCHFCNVGTIRGLAPLSPTHELRRREQIATSRLHQ